MTQLAGPSSSSSSSGTAMRQALQELDALLARGTQMEEFLSRYLDLVLTVTRAPGGAIWSMQGSTPHVLCRARFEESLYEANASQRESITTALFDASQNLRPLLVGPSDAEGLFFEALKRRLVNLTQYWFIYVPAAVITGQGRKAAPAVTQVWAMPGQSSAALNEQVQFLAAAGERLARFVEAKRVESLETNTEILQQLYQLSSQLIGQTDLQKISVFLANRGREIIGCERLVVFAVQSGKLRPIAVSNVDVINERSSVVQTQTMLASEALEGGKPVLFQKTAPKTEEIGDISDYFFHSRTEEAFAVPLTGSQNPPQPVGAFLAEFNETKFGAKPQKYAIAVAAQAAKAMEGALEIREIPLLGAMRKLGGWREAFREGARRRTLIRIGTPIGIALLLALIPWKLTLQSDCVAMPAIQGFAVAEVPGRVTSVLVQEGALVQPGQVIATLNDLEVKQELQIAIEEGAKAEAEAARAQARGDEGSRGLALLEATRTARKVEQLRISVEKTNVRSPIDGTVITKQIQNRVGEVLPTGGHFCEVADLRKWEVVCKLTEADLGILDLKLRTDGKANITFVLHSMPDRKFTATVPDLSFISQASLATPGSNVFVVRGAIDDPEAVKLLRSGYTGRSKIGIGYRPSGWLVVRKFVSYLKVRWFQ